MAANDILAALLQGAGAGGRTATGDSSLNSFLNTVAENDIYRQIAEPLSKVQFDYSGMSNAGRAGLGFGQAFISGLLNEYSKRQEGEQLQKVAQILPQLYANPQVVSAPEGVDTQAFQQLKLGALANEFKRGTEKKDKLNDLEGDLLKDLFKSKPTLAMQALGIEAPAQVSPSSIAVTDSPLAQGNLSTNQKMQEYYKANIAADMPPSQAAIAARQQVEGEIKANTKSIDEAKIAREEGQKLIDLANTAKAGIKMAGQTGKFNTVANLYENIASVFGSEEAQQQLRGDALLGSVAPELITSNKAPGAISDYESKMYIGSGPSTMNTPEANAILAQKLENMGKIKIDYADFIDAFKSANSGSTVGADKLWAEYKQAFPIFNINGETAELNQNRPDWREYFAAKGAGGQEMVLKRNKKTGEIRLMPK